MKNISNISGYINNYEEAVLLVHAIRLGALPLVTQRLTIDQRECIESGSIFCFIENADGMKRWTDGRIWSPSKICGEFLVYQEVPKHLSKNSIKKRKSSNENLLDNIDIITKIEDFVDRTTLHKKTISIDFDSVTYHIISYYRPIFVNFSFMDIEYFQRLSEALNLFPELKSDAFLRENMGRDPDFFRRYRISPDFRGMKMDDGKRAMLEGIALEVLELLYEKNKETANQKFNKM